MRGKTIYITNSTDSSIRDENIETIDIANINTISNGSVDAILCDCLDTISLKDRTQYFDILLYKLKINGILTTKSINLKLFAKNIYNDNIKIDDANLIFQNINSLIDNDKFYAMISNHQNIKLVENIYSGMNQTTTVQRVS